MVILDTSFLFALFQEQDEFHEEAKQVSLSFDGELVYFSFLVFQELMTLTMSRYSSEEATTISRTLLGEKFPAKIIKLDTDYFELTNDLFKKLGKHRFSFVDVSLLVLARELDARIITFDERLQKESEKI